MDILTHCMIPMKKEHPNLNEHKHRNNQAKYGVFKV